MVPLYRMLVICLALLMVSPSGFAAPVSGDGLHVLFVVADPYAANVGVWSTQLERLGYEVVFCGVQDVVTAYDPAGQSLPADLRVDEVCDVSGFDALFVASQPVDPGSIGYVARDLRSSPAAIDVVRRADEEGLAMYVGASAFGLLLDAGVVSGRTVLSHSALVDACREAGGFCSPSRSIDLPLRDAHLVTGTSWFAFPVETVEAVGRALDDVQTAPQTQRNLTDYVPEFSLSSVDLGLAGACATALGGERADLAASICPLAVGAAVAGTTLSGPTGSPDAVVVRLDETGEPTWVRALGGPGRDYAQAVCAAPDGGCAFAGYTTSVGQGAEDGLVVSLSGGGSVRWVKTLGGAGTDMLFGICAADGGVVVCGTSEIPGAGALALWVAKLDWEGNEIWATRIEGGRSARGLSVSADAEGVAVVGWQTLAVGGSDGLLVRFDQDGAAISSTPVGWTTNNVLEDVVKNADGWLAVGHSASPNREAEATTFVAFDNDGTKRWARRFERSGRYDFGLGAVALDNGGILSCGSGSGLHPGTADALLVVCDGQGKLTSRMHVGRPEPTERVESVCAFEDGLIMVGQTELEPGQAPDMLIVRFDSAAIP
ncbi:MAG: hypothetical protein AB1778_06290 [Candidatus Bipolaricaulota bacterium]